MNRQSRERCEDRLVLLSVTVIIVGLILCVMCQKAQAQTMLWVDTSEGSPTLMWDPVTTKADGTTIPGTEVVKYDCFLSNAITDPNKTNPATITLDPISATQFVVDLGGVEGKYIAGVQALRTLDGEVLSRSDIAWSDNPEVVKDNTPFGLKLYAKPSKPGNVTTE